MDKPKLFGDPKSEKVQAAKDALYEAGIQFTPIANGDEEPSLHDEMGPTNGLENILDHCHHAKEAKELGDQSIH